MYLKIILVKFVIYQISNSCLTGHYQKNKRDEKKLIESPFLCKFKSNFISSLCVLYVNYPWSPVLGKREVFMNVHTSYCSAHSAIFVIIMNRYCVYRVTCVHHEEM